MYDINDTICAVSSASPGAGAVARSIIRISGAESHPILNDIFQAEGKLRNRGITTGKIRLENLPDHDATVYSFVSGHSYTGEDLVEIHTFAAGVVVQRIVNKLLDSSRLADPGEFTLRAYLNGKIDLSQAEAVAEIVASGNRFQLAAAQKLLEGKLCRTIAEIRVQMLDILSLIEAGLDFSTEDIEFVTRQNAFETITAIADRLRDILNSNIRCEQMLDLPAVGIAGLPNAGKSSLLNALLGRERSIVSDRHATTRDVLTGLLDMKNSRCAIFDCAGLTRPSADTSPTDILETLAQQAAIQALKSAEMLLFCIDVSKDDYSEDLAVAKVLKGRQHILVLTKCDLVTEDQLAQKTAQLGEMLTIEPIATSTETGNGIEDLRRVIDEAIVKMTGSLSEYAETIAITERHQRLVREAMENLAESADEINAGNDEVAAMLLRGGYEQLADLETEHIDEAVLERIFSRFCIGK